jgi:hypothetical protein
MDTIPGTNRHLTLHPQSAPILNANQKYEKNKGIFMRYELFGASCVALFFCALFTGCTSPTQAQISPVETAAATTTTPAPSGISPAVTVTTPEFVIPLPPAQFVDLQLTKDRPTSKIHLLYNGGPGEVALQTIRMRVTQPDGTVTDQYMDNGNQPNRGDELIIQGSRGSDHVEVWVTSAGKVYKTIDQQLMSMQ